jgi:hypothetical protein
MKILLLAITISVLLFQNGSPHSDYAQNMDSSVSTENGRAFYGKWEVKEYFSPPLISGLEYYMDSSEAKVYLHSSAIIKEDNIQLFNIKCNSVKYSVSKEPAFDYTYFNYRMPIDTVTGSGTRGLLPDQLGIEDDSVQVVEISCDSDYLSLFVINSSRIVVEFRGTFFFLNRSTTSVAKP